MKNLWSISAILLCSAAAFGQNKPAAPPEKIVDPAQLRQAKGAKPAVRMQEAVRLMEEFIESRKIDTTEFYLASVSLIGYGTENGEKQPAWHFS
jgi:hypothetical protein